MTIRDAIDIDLLQTTVMGLLKRKPSTQKPGLLGERFVAPGQDSDLHNGFVNCATNPVGLKASFHCLTGEEGIGLVWENRADGYDGYPGIIHGGVIASLLDELMANVVLACEGLFGVTTGVQVRYLRPVARGVPVTGVARVTKRLGRLRKSEATLFVEEKPAATASAVFFLPTLSQFKKMAKVSEVPREFHENFFDDGT